MQCLRDILKSSPAGHNILERQTKYGEIRITDQKKIIYLFVEYLNLNEIKISRNDMEKYSEEIVAIFTKEIKVSYFSLIILRKW